MGLFLVLWIVTCLVLQAQVAWTEIRIQPARNNTVQASLNTTFFWSRDSRDLPEFYVGKLMHNDDSLSEPQHVYSNNKTKGNITFSFHKPGKFHLVAFKHDHKLNTTGIKLKNVSHVSTSQTIHVLELGNISSSTSNPTTSMTSAPSKQLSEAEKASNSTPIIIAACLGAALLAVISLFAIYFILRRRRRRLLPPDLNSRYAFAAPSPTPSRAWLLRKFRDSPGDSMSTIDMNIKPTDGNSTSWPDSRNFYHTPRPPRKAMVKKPRVTGSSVVSNGTDTSLSSMKFSAKTERQMEIEERIEELNGKLALLQRSVRTPTGRPDSRTLANMTHNMRIGKWRNRIEKLQELMTSDWALGRTDVIPKGLYGPESIV